MKDLIITGAENIDESGLTLKLNKPTKLHPNGIKSDEWWVSWDMIGEAIFDDYTNKTAVADRDKLRKKAE